MDTKIRLFQKFFSCRDSRFEISNSNRIKRTFMKRTGSYNLKRRFRRIVGRLFISQGMQIYFKAQFRPLFSSVFLSKKIGWKKFSRLNSHKKAFLLWKFMCPPSGMLKFERSNFIGVSLRVIGRSHLFGAYDYSRLGYDVATISNVFGYNEIFLPFLDCLEDVLKHEPSKFVD